MVCVTFLEVYSLIGMPSCRCPSPHFHTPFLDPAVWVWHCCAWFPTSPHFPPLLLMVESQLSRHQAALATSAKAFPYVLRPLEAAAGGEGGNPASLTREGAFSQSGRRIGPGANPSSPSRPTMQPPNSSPPRTPGGEGEGVDLLPAALAPWLHHSLPARRRSLQSLLEQRPKQRSQREAVHGLGAAGAAGAPGGSGAGRTAGPGGSPTGGPTLTSQWWWWGRQQLGQNTPPAPALLPGYWGLPWQTMAQGMMDQDTYLLNRPSRQDAHGLGR